MAEKCANRSSPPSSGVMKPNPLASLNHLTVPVLLLVVSLDMTLCLISSSTLHLPICLTVVSKRNRKMRKYGSESFFQTEGLNSQVPRTSSWERWPVESIEGWPEFFRLVFELRVPFKCIE